MPELGLRIQKGFQVSLFADSDLANDIQAIAIDPHGEVVVTGPGYLKTLHDPEGKGRADRYTLLASPTAGGTGLCFDGSSLYLCSQGWLSRYDNPNQAGGMDRPPFNLFPLGAGEPGGHAIHKGPDGFIYFMGGKESGLNAKVITAPGSPVPGVEGGALARFAADGRGLQVLAQGLRHATDFDFDVAGEIFTVDSGSDHDLYLPWHMPSRLQQLAPGGHYGWRSNGPGLDWARPDYYADTGEALLAMGSSVPGGLLCYKHKQFPIRYRSGVFALDWAAGRLLFVELQPDGAGYQARAEVFLESIPPCGFTPSGMVVGTNGSIYVCSGGRKTRGVVIRIDYAGPPLIEPVLLATPSAELNLVLQAPQPLEAWSRAAWVPAAQELGAAPFLRVAIDETVDPLWRARAIEVATELFGGLSQAQADAAASSASPLVRARTAWSMGRAPGPNPSLVLFRLLSDPHPLVRRCALEAITEHLALMDSPELARLLQPNFGVPDKQVRQAAARLGSMLSEPTWQRLSADLARAEPGRQLTGLLAQIWRRPGSRHPELLTPLVKILAQTKEPLFQRDALRLIILALGDWNLQKPSLELYCGYEAAALPANQEAILNQVRILTHALFPSGNPQLDTEASRLLAMLRDNDARVARGLLGFITSNSPVQTDFHCLVCFSRLAAWPDDLTPRVADAFLNLDRKVGRQAYHPEQNWNRRLSELLQVLLAREPKLVALLLNHPRFANPEHLALVPQLGPQHQVAAAKAYLAAVGRDPKFPWSVALINLLSVLPDAEVRPLWRAQWNDVLLREALVARLAIRPEVSDAGLFWQGLSASQPEVTEACISALLAWPREQVGTNLLACFGLLRRLVDEPAQKALRAHLLKLISVQTGRKFNVEEPDPPARPSLAHAAGVRLAFQPVFDWLAQTYPAIGNALGAGNPNDPVKWLAFLKAVPWNEGDPVRGWQVFATRGCAACHTSASALGPNLAGVTARLSTNELWSAIVFPSHAITEAYRPVAFLLRDAQVVIGLPAFTSAEMAIVQTTPAATLRLMDTDIVERQPARVSFMPPGLLEGLSPADLADLYRALEMLPRNRDQ